MLSAFSTGLPVSTGAHLRLVPPLTCLCVKPKPWAAKLVLLCICQSQGHSCADVYPLHLHSCVLETHTASVHYWLAFFVAARL